MPSCQRCSGAGRLGAGWLSAGQVCLACDGTGATRRPQHPCVSCKGQGAQVGWLGSGALCRACDGMGYVMHRQRACRGCVGSGSLGPWYRRRTCPACHGRRYVVHTQHDCCMCDGTGRVASSMFASWSVHSGWGEGLYRPVMLPGCAVPPFLVAVFPCFSIFCYFLGFLVQEVMPRVRWRRASYTATNNMPSVQGDWIYGGRAVCCLCWPLLRTLSTVGV